jgi:hypothetical protein
MGILISLTFLAIFLVLFATPKTIGIAIAQTDLPLQEVAPESNNNTEVSDNNNDTANGTSSNSGMEQMTLKAQLKPDKFLADLGYYAVKKFRFAVNDGSEICPSNNCEYRIENGQLWPFGGKGSSSPYIFDGKLKVTIPEDGASKSKFYDMSVNLDKTGEEETGGETIAKFDGLFGVGPHITYDITNATLEVDKKSPVLTIEGVRGQQNSTSQLELLSK